MSSGYNEADISAGARHVHRALASLQEELEAVDYYNQRAEQSDDDSLKAILIHNRNEEVEHAVMLFEWIRRAMPVFDEVMKIYLFTNQPITEIEGQLAGKSKNPGTLGIGSMK